MTGSPYSGKSESSWLAVTRRLVGAHPLQLPVLRDAAVATWSTLWQTTLGEGQTSVRLSELSVPATVVGYFFEVLLARELGRRFPGAWRGNRSKEEKDLVYEPDPSLSIEVKTSGQLGLKVFGNRSYGQKASGEAPVKKEKSGYYVTVNFFERVLTLIRFGWIDADDWDPQQAATGQMAGLRQAVYDYKLLPVPGSYRRHAPIRLLEGVGETTDRRFAELGIRTVGDLLGFTGDLPRNLTRVRELNRQFIAGCDDDAA